MALCLSFVFVSHGPALRVSSSSGVVDLSEILWNSSLLVQGTDFVGPLQLPSGPSRSCTGVFLGCDRAGTKIEASIGFRPMTTALFAP